MTTLSLLRASLFGQWVPSCSSASGMQLLHMAASCGVMVPQPWRSASTAAAASSSSSTPSKKKQQQQQPSTAATAQAAAASTQSDRKQQQNSQVLLQELQQQYQRSRLLDFFNQHLSRELMLKLNVRSAQQLPRVRSIDLSVSAKDLHGKRYVEKWEMLLPALALEYISGEPATFVHSTVKYYRSRNAVTAVKVHLAGGAAMDMLQKLTYVVLPSQNGFAGISSRSFDRAGNLHFRVARMANFPDFEEQFEIFENLGSLHVSINLANVSAAPERSRLLLTGLQLPILHKVKGADAAAAEEGEEGNEGDEEEADSSDDDGSDSD